MPYPIGITKRLTAQASMRTRSRAAALLNQIARHDTSGILAEIRGTQDQ